MAPFLIQRHGPGQFNADAMPSFQKLHTHRSAQTNSSYQERHDSVFHRPRPSASTFILPGTDLATAAKIQFGNNKSLFCHHRPHYHCIQLIITLPINISVCYLNSVTPWPLIQTPRMRRRQRSTFCLDVHLSRHRSLPPPIKYDLCHHHSNTIR